ncbi:hypothetical protein, partial [Paramuribaculum intestinale]|uniref:hypothetical protein n=1 Tax=Paramuribaculum intestinale TaxID=2094151 RepID=UPI00273335B4
MAKNQPCEIKSTKIRLVAQRREIFAQIIEVKVVLRLLELHDLTFFMRNQRLKYVDEIILIHNQYETSFEIHFPIARFVTSDALHKPFPFQGTY